MTWRMTVGILTLALFMLPGYAAAQDVGSSLDELLQSGELRPGDGVYVTDATGRRVSADVVDMSSSGLELTNGRHTWTLPARDVRRIQRRDSWESGAWLGGGIGAGAAILTGILSESNNEQRGYVAAALILPSMAAGAFIGGIADAFTHKTIYRKAGSARVRVSPMVSTERVGAAASISW